MAQRKVEVGFVYGRLTVLRKSDSVDTGGKPMWDCKCCCGNLAVITKATGYVLSKKTTPSCGCVQLEKRRDKHIEILRKHNRLELVGVYRGDKHQTDYRCLTHGEIHPSTPSNAAQGSGLKCCRDATIRESNRKSFEEAKRKFQEVIAGRFELRGEYKSAMTRVPLYCLRHKEIHLGYPYQMISRGGGLKCCGRATRAHFQQGQIKASAANYDSRIAETGKVRRVGTYVRSSIKILHECLAHGESHFAAPQDILRGQGLICCREAGKKKYRDRIMSGKERELIEFCANADSRVDYLGDYRGMHTPVEFRCRAHGQIHLSAPHEIFRGQGLACCRRGGSDLVDNAIDGSLRWKDDPEWLYLFHLKRFDGFVKLGIAKDYSDDPDETTITKRDEDPEYGEEIALWFFDTRLDAFLVEEALFHATIEFQDCPEELIGWGGFTEIRRGDADLFYSLGQYLVDEFHELGRWGFALAHVPMNSKQRKQAETLRDSET